MEINQDIINKFVKDIGIRPDKDLGQNFLVDSSVSSKIAGAIEPQDNDLLLEIGGGFGSITHFLYNKTKSFDVVDIDERMCKVLSDIYKNTNLNIINKDIRACNVTNYTKIIGNLPYYITTELVTFMLLNAENCEKFVFMVQKEAVDRFVEITGKEYGAISVLAHLLGTPRRLFNVKPGSFYPMPKCGSTVFEIMVNKNNDRKKAISVYKMAKQLFLNRRKTILNNLSNYLKDRNCAEKVLENVNISPTTRPEQIAPENYIKIFDAINNK